MRATLPLAAMLALAGCLAPGEWLEPMDLDIQMDWGSIAIGSLVVEPRPAPLGEVAARVALSVRTTNAEAPRVEVWLDDEGCSRYGPPSAPSTPIAGSWEQLPDGNQTWTFDARLEGSAVRPGTHASVFVAAEAENAIGPIFGECEEFLRPLPRVP